MDPMRLYVGTFTRHGNREGIFWFQFDPGSGRLVQQGAADAGPDPAFLTFSQNGLYLYCVNEVHEYQGQKGGGVSAFALDPVSGNLSFLNSRPSYGESPCYISLEGSGRWVMVSNYEGGSIAVYPIQMDGLLGPACEFIQHEGKGVNPARQEKAHAHSIRMDPTNHVALVTDLGLDQVKMYWFDQRTGKLHNDPEGTIHLHPGAGPRHFDFHPNGNWLYVVDELDSTLAVFQVKANQMRFTRLQTLSTLPDGYDGEKWAADVHVHPNGKWVYASNRAHESIAAFSVDPFSGKATLMGVTPSGGKTPRNFGIDPSGEWLFVGNQDSDNLVIFKIDPNTGGLIPTGNEVAIPMPVCIKFLPA